mmetsp:Transcript_2783/g.5720  ORF Transcript_2783/g.5720 Transcript_2783/m.5720 type:complete len:394 (-) Transcript_2783:181-1362(-)
MKFFLASFATILLTLGYTVNADHGHESSDDNDKVQWEHMEDLPSARSDLTATLVSVGGQDKIYLFGGCAADQGRDSPDGYYYCPTITAKCDVFDPTAEAWNQEGDPCTDAPRVRYRHTAVAVDNKIYLIGGVDGSDAEVKEIDVYDPSDDSWSLFGTWDAATSDLASFVIGTEVYIVGGYFTDTYTAQSSVWMFDTAASSFSLTQVNSLKHPRGDIFATTSDRYVYVTGGFTHYDWSKPLASVERLDITQSDAKWERVANMTHGRGDKALMHMNGMIYAVGGEKAGYTAIKDVEVFDEETEEWTVKGEIVDPTFRFVAVAHEPTDSIYIFGGQNYLDESCDCFRISAEVLRFVDRDWAYDDIDAGGPGSIASLSAAVGSLAVAFVVGAIAVAA